MDILKPMVKCCRWCCRGNIIVLIWVSVVLIFHKCSCLLRLVLYTVSTLCVNNDAAIVAHICYISLLRCNYFTSIWLMNRKTFVDDTYYVKGTENCFLESASLFYWKLFSYSLTALERRRQFRSRSHLVSEKKINLKPITFTSFVSIKPIKSVV